MGDGGSDYGEGRESPEIVKQDEMSLGSEDTPKGISTYQSAAFHMLS